MSLATRLRRLSPPPAQGGDQCPSGGAGAGGPGAAKEEGSLLSVVNLLHPKYRAVIYLYCYEGYAAKEIAELLGERPATVSTRLSRGRQQLRTLLGSEELT